MLGSSLANIRRMSFVCALFAFAVVACSNQVLPPQANTPSAAATGHRIPANIDATGAQDVSATLQAWLNSLPDSSRIIGPAGARYRVEFGLMVENRRGFHLDAEDPKNPPTLFQTLLEPSGAGHRDNRNRMVLGFRLGGGHSLRNWSLQGAHKNSGADGEFIAELEGQHGLLIAGVDGMLVEDVRISEVAGDFVYLTNRFADGVNHLNRDIEIRRVKGRKNGRQGVAVTGGVNVLIEYNDFQDIKRSAFDIEPNGERGTVQHLTVRKNVFGTFRNAWVAGHGAGDADVHDITFEDNEVIGRPLVLQLRGQVRTSLNPDGKRRSNIRVANNRAHSIASISTTGMTVMEFSGLDSVEVVGNVVEFSGQKRIGVGAWFNETCGIVYKGNKWGNAEYDHKVTTSYDAGGSPVTQFDVGSLEWPRCPKSTP
jgi:parallel beta helix pectate lyase-like protein